MQYLTKINLIKKFLKKYNNILVFFYFINNVSSVLIKNFDFYNILVDYLETNNKLVIDL